MANFWRVVNAVIDHSDLIIEVLDARFPEASRNSEVEKKVLRQHKQIIYVLNKSDLIRTPFKDIQLTFSPAVWVSAQKNLGTTQLRKLIRQLEKKRPLYIGILGYPNTGKSSLINALKQKHSANTSPKPGFTKALQKLKIAPEIYVFDTPGVIPYGERDPLKHALMAAADPNIIKDPDIVAMHIIERFYKENKSVFEIFYGIEMAEDPVETLERLAKRLNALKKGGKPDIMKTARKIIEDWQRGKVIL